MSNSPEMGQILFLFASGRVFFPGIIIAAIGGILCSLSQNRLVRATCRVVSLFGMVLVVLSTTPLPLWSYIAWFLPLGSLFAPPSWLPSRVRLFVIAAVVLTSAAIFSWEASYHATPRLAFPSDKAISVIGDSLSAPLGKKSVPWPTVLASLSGYTVTNLAIPGNTTLGAEEQAPIRA